MRVLLYFLFLVLMMSCGGEKEEASQDTLPDYIDFHREEYDFPGMTDEKINELQRIAQEFVKYPHDLNKLKEIEKILKNSDIIKKGIDILEKIERKEERSTALSFILSRYYLKLGRIAFSRTFYGRENFDWIRDIEEGRGIFREYAAAGELISFLEGNRKSYRDSLKIIESARVKENNVIKANIVEFFERHYPGVLILRRKDHIAIDLSGFEDQVRIKNTMLISGENILLNVPWLYFDLVSGIQTKNGASIVLEVRYLENGIFVTTDTKRNFRAGDGTPGRSGEVNHGGVRRRASSGSKGARGADGLKGGDVYISSEISPDSACLLRVCRTMVVLNGSVGQDGGNGGRGGDGAHMMISGPDLSPGDFTVKLSTAYSKATSLPIRTASFHDRIVSTPPKPGGRGGRGGAGGEPGKLVIKRKAFAANTLIKYALKGKKGKEGRNGRPGVMKYY